ncbi:MAG: orotidine-5'-phosphate decarboxylase [Flavobacteriaceae bacterium]
MRRADLIQQIQQKRSFLCVGLDIDLEKIPEHLQQDEDPLWSFGKAIVDATAPYAVAFKPNIAFFETYGQKGWQSLEKLMGYIHQHYPDIFTIADAKRGDIGNTATRYAKAFFEQMQFDSITVAPYMGRDSVEPFLAFEERNTILLGLTSNAGAQDFQYLLADGQPFYQHVLQKSMEWKGSERLMYVVGATRAEALADIRATVPDAFLLVPGVGAQGGSLEDVAAHGLNPECGLLVNSSRGIIYADHSRNFAAAAAEKAADLQASMADLLEKYDIFR